jgi:hypothetical protein
VIPNRFFSNTEIVVLDWRKLEIEPRFVPIHEATVMMGTTFPNITGSEIESSTILYHEFHRKKPSFKYAMPMKTLSFTHYVLV